MKRTLALAGLGLGLACLPSLSLAQVAATDLMPGQVRYLTVEAGLFNSPGFTPDNPAALMWGGPSRIGLGHLEHKGPANGAMSSETINGDFIGGRWVGERIALGAEYLSAADDAASVRLEQKLSSAQIAFKVADFLSFGVALDNEELDTVQNLFTPAGTTIPVPVSTDTTDKLLGVSLNLGDWLYLGYGAGSEEQQRTEFGASQNAQRNVTQSGIAVRTLGTVRVYLAYDVIDRSDFSNVSGPAGDGVTFSSGTAQLGVWNALVGYSQTDVHDKHTPNDTVQYSHYDMAWAPEKGLALAYRRAKLTLKPALAPAEQTFSTDSIVATYLF
jgi:hypothetical protein